MVVCSDVVKSSWCEEETLGDFLRKNVGNWVSVGGKRPRGATDEAAEQWEEFEPKVSPCSLFIITSAPSHSFLNSAFFLCAAVGLRQSGSGGGASQRFPRDHGFVDLKC